MTFHMQQQQQRQAGIRGKIPDRIAMNANDFSSFYVVIPVIRIQRGPKPLEKKTFYLDIKNHGLSAKLESRIKELGGVSISYIDDCLLMKIVCETNYCSNYCVRHSSWILFISCTVEHLYASKVLKLYIGVLPSAQIFIKIHLVVRGWIGQQTALIERRQECFVIACLYIQ